jgi:hypothetical protein
MERFKIICGFCPADFRTLSRSLSEGLEVRRRGHPPVIGPINGFLLFLRWLRCAASIAKIAAAFELNPDTLQKSVHSRE